MRPMIFFFCLLIFIVQIVSPQNQSKRIITGKCVFIFGPSLVEADTISSDKSEALNDFATYSSEIAKFVRERGIQCEYISARQIKVQYAIVKQFIVDRDSIEFGTLLTDGLKEPLLLKYVMTDADLEQKCKEYFNLK